MEQIHRYKLLDNGRAQIGWEHDQHFDFIVTSPDFIVTSPASTADKQQRQQQQKQLDFLNHPSMLTRHGRYVLKTTTTTTIMVLILMVECNSTRTFKVATIDKDDDYPLLKLKLVLELSSMW
eukprot:scaffold1960_cov69-Cylindrotheca_fusiformis.AAC.5